MYSIEGLKDGVVDPVAPHYEEKFEFPLWKLIKQRAEEKDISYCQAAAEVEPEYSRTLRIRDVEWSDAQIWKSDADGFREVMSVNVEGYKLKE